VNRELDGHHALVTGGGGGLGRGCALALARAGARVTVVGRRAGPLQETVASSAHLPGTIAAAPGDVTDEAAVEAIVGAADDAQPLTILIAAAGVNRPAPIVEQSLADFELIWRANVLGCFLSCRAFGRRLLAAGRPGRVVLISSQMGEVGYPGRSAYCASKHAVNGMVRALATEWARDGITVNAVSPTFVRTPLTEPMFEDKAFEADVLRRIPAGHLAEIEHVAAAVLYLVSDAAAMTTGQSLAVDGGWTAW
jgi:NAD(P)-dependent dehydrogenase (short-subunit alcohol dehydrogenase family)